MSTVDEVTTAVNWRTQAACRGADPGMMFPEDGDAEAEQAAKGICEDCPVQLSCLDHAIAYNECDGVWGGRTERERKSYRRRLLRVAHERRVAADAGVVVLPLFVTETPVLAPR